VRKPPLKVIIEEWDGDGAIRIPDEALQELELDVGDAVYLIEEFVGNTRCLVLSKKPQIEDRIDELTEACSGWRSGLPLQVVNHWTLFCSVDAGCSVRPICQV